MGQLQGKVAIVTGAAGGFGEGIAKLFVAEGARVLIVDLDGAKARRWRRRSARTRRRSSATCRKAPTCAPRSRRAAIAFGPPDIVVNNAGTTHRNQWMLDVDEATFDRVFNVNVKSIYHMAQAVVPIMRERKGAPSSTSARRPASGPAPA